MIDIRLKILFLVLLVGYVCYYGLSKIRRNVIKSDFEELEKTAIKEVTARSNIVQIADALDELGFTTSITSKGGVDRSDLLLTIKKKERVLENEES